MCTYTEKTNKKHKNIIKYTSERPFLKSPNKAIWDKHKSTKAPLSSFCIRHLLRSALKCGLYTQAPIGENGFLLYKQLSIADSFLNRNGSCAHFPLQCWDMSGWNLCSLCACRYGLHEFMSHQSCCIRRLHSAEARPLNQTQSLPIQLNSLAASWLRRSHLRRFPSLQL